METARALREHTTTLGSSLLVPQKVKCRVTVWLSNYTPRSIPERTENICLRKKTCTPDVHSIEIHNRQKVETSQLSVNWQVDKQNMVRIYTMQYYSALKRVKLWCVPQHEPWGNATWEEQVTRDHKVSDPIYVNRPEEATLWRHKVDRWLPSVGAGRHGATSNRHTVSLGDEWKCSKIRWWWSQNSEHKAAELYSLKGWILWYVNYISIKLLVKNRRFK